MNRRAIWTLGIVIFAWTGAVSAHGGHGEDALSEFLEENPAFQALRDHLSQLRQRSIETNQPLSSEDDAQVGRELAAAVEAEWKLALATLPKASSSETLRNFVGRFNLVEMGKWLVRTSQVRGPTLAISYLGGELFESGMYLMAGAMPPLAPVLVPLAASHVTDTVAIGAGLALPKAARATQLWYRHGGLFHGARAYYDFLVRQREALPLDWGQILGVGSVPSKAGDVKIALTAHGALARQLPEALQVVFTPAALATRQKTPTIDVSELERLARDNGVEIASLKKLKSERALYASLLLERLSGDPATSSKLADLARERNQGSDGFWDRAAAGADLAELSDHANADALVNSTEDPAALARRLYWRLGDARAQALAEVEEHHTIVPKELRERIQALNRAIDGPWGILEMAETNFKTPRPANYRRLLELNDQASHAIDALNEATEAMHHGATPPGPCGPWWVQIFSR